MATLTIPHLVFHHLDDLQRAVSGGWRRLKQGRLWVEARSTAGWMGDTRALEVTHGGNGWHPHLHVLLVFKPDACESAIAEFSRWLFRRWRQVISRLTGRECSDRAYAWERVGTVDGAAKYLSKWGPAHELTSAHTKLARRNGRTPFQILFDWDKSGSAVDAKLFREFAAAFKGVRQLTWSKGLRERYLAKPEPTDAELAECETEGEDIPAPRIAALDAKLYRQVTRRGLECELKFAIEDGGIVAVCALLTSRNIPWLSSMTPGPERGEFIPLLSLGLPRDKSPPFENQRSHEGRGHFTRKVNDNG